MIFKPERQAVPSPRRETTLHIDAGISILRARMSLCVAAFLRQRGDGLFKQLGHQDVLVADDALGVDWDGRAEVDRPWDGGMDSGAGYRRIP